VSARSVARGTAFTVLALAACAVQAQVAPPAIPGPSRAPAAASAAPADACIQCGLILSIRQTTVKQSWTPLGTGASFDSDARAVTQFQFGPGLTNQGMVIVGAGGGAAYRKSPNSYEQPRWEVTVKLDNGQTRVVTLAYEPYVVQGDRVRISGNNVELVD
jgi:outer membrane lipoprotein SlyB